MNLTKSLEGPRIHGRSIGTYLDSDLQNTTQNLTRTTQGKNEIQCSVYKLSRFRHLTSSTVAWPPGGSSCSRLLLPIDCNRIFGWIQSTTRRHAEGNTSDCRFPIICFKVIFWLWGWSIDLDRCRSRCLVSASIRSSGRLRWSRWLRRRQGARVILWIGGTPCNTRRIK